MQFSGNRGTCNKFALCMALTMTDTLRESLVFVNVEHNEGSGYVTLSPSPSMRDRESEIGDSESCLLGNRSKTSAFLAVCCVASVLYMSASSYSVWKPVITNSTRAPGLEGLGSETVTSHDVEFLQLPRASFHFQPLKHWKNGPIYYKGRYHLFYQYNPDGLLWGNITWGHAVSTDLVHWLYLETALKCDKGYDMQGAWSGSVSMAPNGTHIILYTGPSNASEETLNIALPADASDPLLRKWVKAPENPVLRHPEGIYKGYVRDPTTAWKGDDGIWRKIVRAKISTTGMAFLYKSEDLKHWELDEKILHRIPGTGMWECVDFFPIPPFGQKGLDGSRHGNSVTYAVKVRLDDNDRDYYALVAFDKLQEAFIPDDPALDAGPGLRYDYGKFHASKTLFDPVKQRRILFGWVNESDSESQDIAKGWSSVQAVPRTLCLDGKAGSMLLQNPVEEVTALRGSKVTRTALKLEAGAVVKVDGASGSQLDVEVTFDYPNISNAETEEGSYMSEKIECSQGSSTYRGMFGPFGLLVLTDNDFQEQTAIFFYITRSKDGLWSTQFCSDHSRSSLRPDNDRTLYGSYIRVLPSDDYLSLRTLVDRSIVESFVQGGRVVITSRVYPKVAVDNEAHLFLFNNATTPIVVRSIDAWQMNSATTYAI